MALEFKCVQCEKVFAQERNLKRHSATHQSEEDLYHCEQCAFTSSRKDSVKRHGEMYHKQGPSADNNGCYKTNLLENSVKPPDHCLVQRISPDVYFDSNSFDGRLQLPHNFIYAGASQSGKTTLLMKTLKNASQIYNPVPTRVFFLYSCFQQNYAQLKETLAAQGIQSMFLQSSVVTERDLESMADPNGGQTLIIVDDNSIAAASSKEMAQVFTIARHKNCSMVLLLHFIFGPWPSSRIISANTSYYFLLKSPRMTKQIATLGAQLGKQSAVLSAYERETLKSYGYILLDLCTATPEHKRLRSNIFEQNSSLGPEKICGTEIKDIPLAQQDKSIQTEQMMETEENVVQISKSYEGAKENSKSKQDRENQFTWRIWPGTPGVEEKRPAKTQAEIDRENSFVWRIWSDTEDNEPKTKLQF